MKHAMNIAKQAHGVQHMGSRTMATSRAQRIRRGRRSAGAAAAAVAADVVLDVDSQAEKA